MTGHVLLAGGAEFGGAMATADREALALAGGPDTPIRIVPTAAAPDNNHRRAGNNGVRWFQSLGATDVAAVPLIDARSANDKTVADELRNARMIYMLGGFPGYLANTLRGTPCWAAMQEAYAAGAVLAGSSAGAMALCEYLYDPFNGTIIGGLGLVRHSCVLPHHNTMGSRWAAQLQAALPHATLIGIDERTALLSSGSAPLRQWRVVGPGEAVLYRANQVEHYASGATLLLDAPA